jgi:hypothetical protein
LRASRTEWPSAGGIMRMMEVIGAAMRKLVHIACGVLKWGRPFGPELKTA